MPKPAISPSSDTPRKSVGRKQKSPPEETRRQSERAADAARRGEQRVVEMIPDRKGLVALLAIAGGELNAEINAEADK